MRMLEGDQVLVRIMIGEAEKWRHQPLATALMERLRTEGFAGASLFRGIMGFGASSILRAAHILDISMDLPQVIEVVDTESMVQTKLVPILDEMVQKGLVTMEKVHVLRYHPPLEGKPRADAGRKPGRIRRAIAKARVRRTSTTAR